MMRLMQIKTHWPPEEAYSLLMLLDELRDTIWANYRDEIIEHCHQQEVQQPGVLPGMEDDQIPF